MKRIAKTRLSFYIFALSTISFGLFAQSGSPVSAISEARFEALQKASAEGSVTAMVELAGIYLTGARGKPEPRLAVELYRRATTLGDADATFHLGNMYLMGDGVRRDENQAFQLFKQAAEQGHPLAIKNYESLRRLQAGETAASPLPQSTTSISSPSATLDEITAIQLARRQGVEIDFSGTRDPTTKRRWIPHDSPAGVQSENREPSAAQKSEAPENIFRQAEQLYFGEGVSKDEAVAITLYRRAARAGHAQAKSRLLTIYTAAGIDPPRCRTPESADEICF